AAFRRLPARAAFGRSPRTTASRAPPCRCRRTPRDRRAAPRPPGRDCSSASGARPPGSSPCTFLPCRAVLSRPKPALANANGELLDVGSERTIPGKGRRILSHGGVHARDRLCGTQRLQILEPLRAREQLDRYRSEERRVG